MTLRTIFVLLKCELGESYVVADRMSLTFNEVKEVWSISGEYDLLVKLDLPEHMNIGRFITEKIQVVPGIRETSTIMSFKIY